jgi:hypothetical protein
VTCRGGEGRTPVEWRCLPRFPCACGCIRTSEHRGWQLQGLVQTQNRLRHNLKRFCSPCLT